MGLCRISVGCAWGVCSHSSQPLLCPVSGDLWRNCGVGAWGVFHSLRPLLCPVSGDLWRNCDGGAWGVSRSFRPSGLTTYHSSSSWWWWFVPICNTAIVFFLSKILTVNEFCSEGVSALRWSGLFHHRWALCRAVPGPLVPAFSRASTFLLLSSAKVQNNGAYLQIFGKNKQLRIVNSFKRMYVLWHVALWICDIKGGGTFIRLL